MCPTAFPQSPISLPAGPRFEALHKILVQATDLTLGLCTEYTHRATDNSFFLNRHYLNN